MLAAILGYDELILRDLARRPRGPAARRADPPCRRARGRRSPGSCWPSRGARCSSRRCSTSTSSWRSSRICCGGRSGSTSSSSCCWRRSWAASSRPRPGRAGHPQPGGERPRRHARGRQPDDRDAQRRPSTRPTASGTSTRTPGDYVLLAHQRHRFWHGPGDARSALRAVLHDQGGGRGHRARPVDGLRLRHSEWRGTWLSKAFLGRGAASASTCPG